LGFNQTAQLCLGASTLEFSGTPVGLMMYLGSY
jgi:hypothetical protein